jgi:hypothetical protein
MYRIEETRGVHGQATGSEDPIRFLHCPAEIGDVFQHLVGDHGVGGLRREGTILQVNLGVGGLEHGG